jgi:hypothetical protein
VLGSPQAIPNVFTARLLALRVLHSKFPAIVDAMEPGGSGDIYAGLDKEEREVLAEVTRLGFPVRGWFNYKTIGMGAFPILFITTIRYRLLTSMFGISSEVRTEIRFTRSARN